MNFERKDLPTKSHIHSKCQGRKQETIGNARNTNGGPRMLKNLPEVTLPDKDGSVM